MQGSLRGEGAASRNELEGRRMPPFTPSMICGRFAPTPAGASPASKWCVGGISVQVLILAAAGHVRGRCMMTGMLGGTASSPTAQCHSASCLGDLSNEVLHRGKLHTGWPIRGHGPLEASPLLFTRLVPALLVRHRKLLEGILQLLTCFWSAQLVGGSKLACTKLSCLLVASNAM